MEFDDQEWEKREWVKVYEDFQLFLLEHQLVWAKRKEGAGGGGAGAGGGAGGLLQATKAKHIQWPALVRPLFSIYRLGTVIGAVSHVTLLLKVHYSAFPKIILIILHPHSVVVVVVGLCVHGHRWLLSGQPCPGRRQRTFHSFKSVLTRQSFSELKKQEI